MSEKSSGLTNRGALQAPLNVKRDYQDANQSSTSDILTERDVRSAFLEDILTKEQNTCIEIRDICTGISNDAKEALRSGCSREFIKTLKEQMQTLQAGIELLDDAAGKKTMLEDEFVEKGTMEWLARRFSSETRRRRLRGHKRRPKQDSDDFELPKSPKQGTPASSPSSSFELFPPYAPKIAQSPKLPTASPTLISKPTTTSFTSSPNLGPHAMPYQPSPSSPILGAPALPPNVIFPPPATPLPLSATAFTPASSQQTTQLLPTKRLSSQMKISNIIN